MKKKYEIEFVNKVEIPVMEENVEGITIAFKLDPLLKRLNIKQLHITKHYENEEDKPIHYTFINRLVKGKILSLNLKQFLYLMAYLRKESGEDLQFNDVFEIVEIEDEEEK